MNRHCFALILLGMLAATGWSQEPATQPATQPAGPRDVFAEFVHDMLDGRPDDLAAVCVAPDDDSRRIVREIQTMTGSMADLQKAMTAKFGPTEARTLFTFVSPDELDNLTETTSGDKSTLKGDAIDSIQMIRVNGQWKVDIPALARDALPEDAHGYFAAQTRAISRTAADVLADKFQSPESAREALEAREMEWENETGNASTKP